MIGDPIIEEIYQARQRLLDECGGDLEKLMNRLRDAETQHPDRVITKAAIQERRRAQKPAILQNAEPKPASERQVRSAPQLRLSTW
jgi:hypothetical protein